LHARDRLERGLANFPRSLRIRISESLRAAGSPASRNCSTSFSLPGLASNRIDKATLTIFKLLCRAFV
jgi:hypothetical protein